MLTPEEISWIRIHAADDTAALRMKHRGDARTAHLINQIDCRRKAASKLKDTLACEAFEFPNELSQEQSTSDRLADFHASLVAEGGTCADLTAGLGIDALHLAARSLNVTAVEINPDTAATLRDNAAALGVHNLEVVCGDCRDVLKHLGRFDTIFIDPARRSASGRRVFALEDCSPDVVAMLTEIGLHTDRLIVKMSPMLDISEVCARLAPYVSRIIALGDRRECKELIAVCDLTRDTTSAATEISAVTLCPDMTSTEFTFTRAGEAEASAVYAEPEKGGYLTDPYPAIMKAAPWRSLCADFSLAMPADNTHLYLGDGPCTCVGESYIIEEVIPYSSGEIKRLSRRLPAASVATRNFPLRADDLRRKLKLRDASSPRLYGITDRNRRQLMVVCRTIGE